jgi:hypothetical protein
MEDFTEPLSPIPHQLVLDLDARFPARCPDIEWPDRQVWHYAGQRAVVEFLKAAYERQQENRFNNVL